MALGVRTPRTLSNRQLWIAMHRTIGYAAVALGALTVYAGLFVEGSRVAGVPGTAFLIILAALTVYYWLASRSHGFRAPEPGLRE